MNSQNQIKRLLSEPAALEQVRALAALAEQICERFELHDGRGRAHFETPLPTPPGASAKPLEQRKSFRWIAGLRDCVELRAQCPDTRIVSVMDREADVFELFDEQRTHPEVALLVRAKSNRCVHGEGESDTDKLFERMRGAPERGRMQVAVYAPERAPQGQQAGGQGQARGTSGRGQRALRAH